MSLESTLPRFFTILRHTPNGADVLLPLTILAHKTPFTWETKCQTTFNHFKDLAVLQLTTSSYE